MNIYFILLLRFIHIVAGILWAGSAVSLMFFVKPTMKLVGPTGPQFMQALVTRRRYPLFMQSTSLATVLAGVVLYFYSSVGLNVFWIRTGPGIGLTLGSLAALIAFFVGNFGIGSTSAKMGALGQKIAASGKPPSPAQLSELQALEKRLNLAEWIDFTTLAISMLTMATARYWTF